MKKVLLICLFIGSFLLSNAQTNTWIGGASGSWSSTSSWSLGVLPTTGHTVVFDGNNIDGSNGTGNISVTAIVRTPIAGLKLTNNANVTFTSITALTGITVATISRGANINTVNTTGGSTPLSSSNFSIGDLLMTGVTGTNIGKITSLVSGSQVTTDETYPFNTTTLYRAATLLISGATTSGQGLIIDAGSVLTMSGTSTGAAYISLLAGATGTVSGRINFLPGTTNNIALRINVTDDGALAFKSGSVFVHGNGTTGVAGGWPFGFNATSLRGKVVFESGANYYQATTAGAGIGATNQFATPFGGHLPASSVEFNDGSNFIFCQGNGASAIGLSATSTSNAFFGINGATARYFSNLRISAGSASFGALTANIGGGTFINFSNYPRINNFTVDASQQFTTAQGSGNGWPILGNVSISGTIPNSSTNANGLRLLFAGNASQNVTGLTTTSPTFSFLGLTVANNANVTFASNLIVNPSGNNTSTVYGRLDFGTNTLTNNHASNTHAIAIAAAATGFTKTGGIVNAGTLIVSGLNNTTSVVAGMGVTGTGIPSGTVVTSSVAAVTIGATNTVTSGSNMITANTLSTTSSTGAGISGSGIPSGTTISALYGTAIITQSCTNTSGSATISYTGATNPFASATGMAASGTGVPANTIITATAGTSPNWTATLSQPTTSGVTSLTATPTIVMSQIATATNSDVTLTSTPSIFLSQLPTASGTGVTLTFSNGVGTLATSTTGGLDGSYTSTNASITQPSSTGNIEINGATITPLPTAWSAAVTLNNFTSSADVTLNKNLTVNGALAVNSGIFTTGSNAVSLGASASGTFGSSSTLSITGTGTVDFAARPVTFQSGASSSATVGNITSSATTPLSGTNIIVERYIPAKRAYRFVTPIVTTTGHPTKPYIKDNWQEGTNNPDAATNNNPVTNYGTHITGTTGNAGGFDVTANNNNSLFTYNNIGAAWTAISNTNATNLLAGNAYRLFVRGSRAVDLSNNAATSSNTIIRAVGSLLTKNVVFGYTGNGTNTVGMPNLNATVGGYSLVGNPYASPVNWDNVYTDAVGLEDYYYIWDPTRSTRGAYVYWDKSDGANGPVALGSTANQHIQPGQAIFVRSTLTTPVLTFKETHKSSTFTNTFRTQANLTGKMSIGLTNAAMIAANNAYDGATILFADNFSSSIDGEDIPKIINQDENLSVYSSLTNLMKESRPTVTANDTVQLKIWQLASTNYILTFNAQEFAGNKEAYLLDAYLNTITSVNIIGNTQYAFATNVAAASFADSRFKIVFKTSGALPVSITSLKAYQKNTGINVEWNVANEINMNNYEVEKSADGINFNKAGTVAAIGSSTYNWFDASPISGNNFYRIKMIDKNGATKNTQVVNVKIGGVKNIFTVIGNPVKNKTVVLQLENVEKGSYSISIFNNAGQQVMNKTITHNGGSALENIGVGNVAAGTYQLNVVGTNGTRFTKTLLVD